MKARLLTLVWGDRHIDWFNRACVSSLCKPKNIASLKDIVSKWDIVTRDVDVEKIGSIAARLGLEIEFHTDSDLSVQSNEALQRELFNQMRRCFEAKEAMILAPPDSIFGDGSIASICAVGSRKGVCVAVPHVRVTPRILDEQYCSASNAKLVEASWRHLHRTWVEADAARELTNTYAGGVSWHQIVPGLYAVTHLLPTVYYANFIETDLQWWSALKAIGSWDHHWPSKLVAEKRQRVIGSSDAAFIAEVTPEFANIPGCTPSDPEEPDNFWGGKAAHPIFNRNHVSFFRAEA